MNNPTPRPNIKLVRKKPFGSPYKYNPDETGVRKYPYTRRTLATKSEALRKKIV